MYLYGVGVGRLHVDVRYLENFLGCISKKGCERRALDFGVKRLGNVGFELLLLQDSQNKPAIRNV